METGAEKWPFSILFRFRYIHRIHKQLAEYSHIIFIDADMYVSACVSEEEFFSHEKPLFGVQHPGNYMRGHSPYELNPGSSAGVTEADDTSMYWQGCFWGGRTKDVLLLSRILAERIDDDLSRDIIARWHDESHLNKYFIEHRASVHTYHPGYAYPEMLAGKLPGEKKIVHVMKDHKNMSSNQIKTTEAKKGANPASGVTDQRFNDDAVLVRKDGCHLEHTPTSIVICDDNHKRIATMNETSAKIWRLCGGNFNVGDVIKIFSVAYSVSPQEVKHDMYPVLCDFIDYGLVSVKNRASLIGKPEVLDQMGRLTQKSDWGGQGSRGFVAHIIEGVLLHKYFDKTKGKVCLAIGCSTGGSLAYISRVFGYFPEGIDYVKHTKDIVKRTLHNNGINDCKIYEEDFLSWQPSRKYDLVLSGGFIEHFSGKLLETVKDKHIELLSPGGRIVITVPNFNYGQYLIHFLLDRDNLAQHNIKTMTRAYYRKIAKEYGLKIIFLGYIGGFFSFWVKNKSLNLLQRMILKGLLFLQRMGIKSPLRSFCNPILSPYLVFIGEKHVDKQEMRSEQIKTSEAKKWAHPAPGAPDQRSMMILFSCVKMTTILNTHRTCPGSD
ncbi:MAG: methyltransferase domain-containing protein [bacterium]|nr:methyltransferase domain-containing protein [bacterium]